MPRYIDADWLLERAVPMGWSTPKWVTDIAIRDAPTIDAVEVVRCKDCKWGDRHGTTDEGKPYYYCIITDWVGQPPEFFCASGERRKETTDDKSNI